MKANNEKPLPIYLYGRDILKEKCKELKQAGFYPPAKAFAQQMISTILATETGVGIAAPQVGKRLRMFVTTDIKREDFTVYINPVILEMKGAKKNEVEGCLSIPKIGMTIERFQKVKIKYFDENWQEHTKLLKGMDARIVMHEYDHLDGILFIDRMDQKYLPIIKYRLADIERGEGPETEYQTISA